jgi:hypothetical protein
VAPGGLALGVGRLLASGVAAGGLALDAGWLLGAVLAVAVLAAVGIAVRRTVLEHGGGTVECGLRRSPDESWRLGLADYQPDELRWFKVFGFRLRPSAVFARSNLSIISRRPAGPDEAASLGDNTVVVECTVGAGDRGGDRPIRGGELVELAMSEAALTGLLAWLEAAPPSGDMPGLA